MAVTVKALKDGPFEVAGGAKLLDVNDKEYAESAIDPLYLCRCGQSKNKPFCDAAATRTPGSRRRRSPARLVSRASGRPESIPLFEKGQGEI
jgi:CDGSH-type Zn-finger protein